MNRAVFYLLFATTLYTVINIGVKLLPLPVSQIVFFRAGISLFACYFLLRRKNLSPWGHNRPMLFLRGLFGTLGLAVIWLTVHNMPLAIATTLFNLTPIFTVVIAHLFLGEKASPLQWLLLLFAFGGVLLIRGGDLQPVSLPWLAMGVLGAVFASLAYTCIRFLKESEDALVIIFYFPLVTLPLAAPFTVIQWQTPTAQQWLILGSIGLITQVAQYFMTRAYQMENAGKIMIFNYAGLIWAMLAGEFLFAEHLSAPQMAGIFLVLGCLCSNYYVSIKATPSPPSPTPSP